MNLDYLSFISILSLFLKIFFIVLILSELALPLLRNITLVARWKSDFRSELKNGAVMTGSFSFAILFLMALDITAGGERPLLILNILLDTLLLIFVLAFLLIPKTYGLLEKGVYLNGLIVDREEITGMEEKDDLLIIKRCGWWREDRRLLLPADAGLRHRVISRIESWGMGNRH